VRVDTRGERASKAKQDGVRQLSWWHYVILAIGMLLLFSVWAVPLRGLQTPTTVDTFLAEIGSLMGAIFTAGGLVLAIAAPITLVTVESKAKDAAASVLRQVRAEIDADLTTALTAYDYLLSARNAIDPNNSANLRYPERLVEEALQKRPELPHAREWIAVTLLDAAFRYFLIHHFNDNFRGIPIGAGSQTDFDTNVHNSIRWLREIIQRTADETERSDWNAYLATAYGLAGNAEDMLLTVAEVPQNSREVAFASRRALLSLAAGLRSAMARTTELHALLPDRFPPTRQKVKEHWLNHRAQSSSLNGRVGVWVLQKSAVHGTPSLPIHPGVVWLLPFADDQVVLRWKKDRGEYVSYPTEAAGAPDIDGALSTLEEHFVPICRVEGDRVPARGV